MQKDYAQVQKKSGAQKNTRHDKTRQDRQQDEDDEAE